MTMATSQTSKPATAANDTAGETTPIDQDKLSLTALAKGVLNRDFRPRASSMRRLAEAVLAGLEPAAKPAKAKAKDGAKAGKKRRLAKIPGQKGKKKKNKKA